MDSSTTTPPPGSAGASGAGQGRPTTSPATQWWPWAATTLRLLLAGVLAVAGALKLPDPAESVRAVRAYQLLPEAVVPSVGYGLPLLEIAVAVLLLLGLLTRWAALVAALLMAAFLVGIGSAWARGLTIDCGCFGGGGQVAAADTNYLPEMVRDGVLLLAAVLLAARPTSRLALDPAPVPAMPAHDQAVAREES